MKKWMKDNFRALLALALTGVIIVFRVVRGEYLGEIFNSDVIMAITTLLVVGLYFGKSKKL